MKYFESKIDLPLLHGKIECSKYYKVYSKGKSEFPARLFCFDRDASSQLSRIINSKYYDFCEIDKEEYDTLLGEQLRKEYGEVRGEHGNR